MKTFEGNLLKCNKISPKNQSKVKDLLFWILVTFAEWSMMLKLNMPSQPSWGIFSTCKQTRFNVSEGVWAQCRCFGQVSLQKRLPKWLGFHLGEVDWPRQDHPLVPVTYSTWPVPPPRPLPPAQHQYPVKIRHRLGSRWRHHCAAIGGSKTRRAEPLYGGLPCPPEARSGFKKKKEKKPTLAHGRWLAGDVIWLEPGSTWHYTHTHPSHRIVFPMRSSQCEFSKPVN